MIFFILALIAGQSRPQGGFPPAPTQRIEITGYREPQIRFAPMAIRATFQIAPDFSVSHCSVTMAGDPEPHWQRHFCENISERRTLEALGVDSAMEGRMTALVRLETNGQSIDAGAVAGRLIFQSEIRFEVRSDGSVANCVRQDLVGPQVGPDPCVSSFPRRPDPFPSAVGQGNRTARLILSLYLDR
jgi:hypothetical protein